MMGLRDMLAPGLGPRSMAASGASGMMNDLVPRPKPTPKVGGSGGFGGMFQPNPELAQMFINSALQSAQQSGSPFAALLGPLAGGAIMSATNAKAGATDKGRIAELLAPLSDPNKLRSTQTLDLVLALDDPNTPAFVKRLYEMELTSRFQHLSPQKRGRGGGRRRGGGGGNTPTFEMPDNIDLTDLLPPA